MQTMTTRRQRIGFIQVVTKACLVLLCVKLSFGRPSFGVQKYSRLFRRTSSIRCLVQSGNTFGRSFLSKCRGGARINNDDDGDAYEEEGEENDDEGIIGENTMLESATSSSSFSKIVAALNSFSKAIVRGVGAAFEVLSSGATEKDTSMLKRVVHMCQSFWTAASSYKDDIDSSADETSFPPTVAQSTTTSTTIESIDEIFAPSHSDFGTYLSTAYGATDGRAKETKSSPVLGTTLNDALAVARQNARLLVVLIPSTAPKAKSKSDIKAIESFLSQQVATISEKKARKKGDTGSFVLWGAKQGSSEATQAMKWLKISPKNIKGKTIPILLVAYPSQVRELIVLKFMPDLDVPPLTDLVA
jgi:hypothetical protein